jgi:hypothetical protein
MFDLKMNNNDDLAIENQSFQLIAGTEQIAQKVKIRLRTFQGEWFLDQQLGVDYYGQIYVKNPNINDVVNQFVIAINDTPGIEEILTFDLELNPETRELDVVFQARAETDETITIEGL